MQKLEAISSLLCSLFVVVVVAVVVLVVLVAVVEYYCFSIIIIVGTPYLPDPAWPLKYKQFSKSNTNTASVS